MTIRDFSDTKKQELLALIDINQLDTGDWWSQVLDFFGDIRIGESLWSYENDITRYHQEITDIKNTASSEIESIWVDVADVEARHLANIQSLKGKIARLAAEYLRLVEVLDPGRAGGLLLYAAPGVLAGFFHDNFDVEEAYDLMVQRQVFALMDSPEFSEDVWATCVSTDEKRVFLNNFFTKLQEVMGVSVERSDIVFTNFNDGALGYFGREHEDANGNWYGRYSVKIENRGLTADNRETLLIAIIHETRHAYQHDVYMDYERRQDIATYRQSHGDGAVVTFPGGASYPPGDWGSLRHPNIGDVTAAAWSNDKQGGMPASSSPADQAQYLSRPKEFDAWSFAGQFSRYRDKWTNNDEIALLNPSYQGHWELPHVQ
jgi:hypothetical protein